MAARDASAWAAAWAVLLAISTVAGSIVPHLFNAEPSELPVAITTSAILAVPVLLTLRMYYKRARARSEKVRSASRLVGAMIFGGILMPPLFLVFGGDAAEGYFTSALGIVTGFAIALLIHIRVHRALTVQS